MLTPFSNDARIKPHATNIVASSLAFVRVFMARLKVPHVKVVLSVDARKQVAMLFSLLVQIDHRVNPKKRKPKKPKSKDLWTRNNAGPFFSPCFLANIVYLEMNFPTHPAELLMIDTVVSTLTKDMFEIHNPDLFTPSAQWVLAGVSRSIVSKQNPTKKRCKII